MVPGHLSGWKTYWKKYWKTPARFICANPRRAVPAPTVKPGNKEPRRLKEQVPGGCLLLSPHRLGTSRAPRGRPGRRWRRGAAPSGRRQLIIKPPPSLPAPRPSPVPSAPTSPGCREEGGPARGHACPSSPPLRLPESRWGAHGARQVPVRSMAEGAEEEGAFLRLPAGQDERYAELLAAGLLPCARDGAGAERGLPEPSAIKSGKGPVGRAPLNGSRGEVAALTEPPPPCPRASPLLPFPGSQSSVRAATASQRTTRMGTAATASWREREAARRRRGAWRRWWRTRRSRRSSPCSGRAGRARGCLWQGAGGFLGSLPSAPVQSSSSFPLNSDYFILFLITRSLSVNRDLCHTRTGWEKAGKTEFMQEKNHQVSAYCAWTDGASIQQRPGRSLQSFSSRVCGNTVVIHTWTADYTLFCSRKIGLFLLPRKDKPKSLEKCRNEKLPQASHLQMDALINLYVHGCSTSIISLYIFLHYILPSTDTLPLFCLGKN